MGSERSPERHAERVSQETVRSHDRDAESSRRDGVSVHPWAPGTRMGRRADWRPSLIIPIFKNKGDAQEGKNYRGIKLLEHVMKIMEKMLDKRLCEVVEVDDMQFGLHPNRGTMDAIFVLRQLQEKSLKGQKKPYHAFGDLEKKGLQ